jgi:serine/threonine protein kinase
METDLHRIIYSKQPLTLEHIQYFIYQILRGLKYIHSANVIHRDLKPSNILVNGNCDLKICDFGLARGLEDEQLGGLTEYVVTRWYRAPEIMLACHEYTKAIDIWSVGCIFAELLGRQALFPGNDYIAQLKLICEKLGRPTEPDMDFITSDRAKRFITSLPDNKPIEMMDLFPEYSTELVATELFQQMMIFHPSHRITIDNALKHPFMSSLHNPEDEPIANFTFQFDFENENLSKERVQELIWNEIHELHPDIPLTFPSSSASSSSSVSSSPSSSSSSLLGSLSAAATTTGSGSAIMGSGGGVQQAQEQEQEMNQKKRSRSEESGEGSNGDQGHDHGSGSSNSSNGNGNSLLPTTEQPAVVRQRTD